MCFNSNDYIFNNNYDNKSLEDTSLTLVGEIPPLYESLYADKLFVFNNSIILNFIASGNNTTFPNIFKKSIANYLEILCGTFRNDY